MAVLGALDDRRGEGTRSPRGLVLGFLARFALIYALLLVPWPGLHAAYADAYREGVRLLAGTLDLRWTLQVHDCPACEGRVDSYLDARHVRTGEVRRYVYLSTRYFGFLATAFVAALILATPVGWRARLIALPAGLALASAFVMARRAAYLLAVFGPRAVGPFEREVREVIAFGPWYVVPVLIWAVLVALPVHREHLRRPPTRST